MSDKQELLQIGRKNLEMLVIDVGGEESFCELMEMSSSYLHNWLKKEPPQQITFKMAAQIERAFNKPNGWLHDGKLIDEEGNQIKPLRTKKRASKSPATEAAVYQSRHDQLQVILQAYIEDTGNSPNNTHIMELMKWSYGKTFG